MDIHEALAEYDGDVVIYFGDISRDGYKMVCDLLEEKQDKKHRVCLVPATYGGDPDAAFRIARAFGHYYDHVDVLIVDICKSAGTLLCVGADRLIFGDRGELGPLDIQLSKPDEMFERVSGLAIAQAVSAIETQMLNSFQSYWISIRNGARLRTKLAADIAAKLVENLLSPISARIDPMTLGEHQRAMQVAYDYGEILSARSRNIKNGGLLKIVRDYPSHGFVIDRAEARTIFEVVESPRGPTEVFYRAARRAIDDGAFSGYPWVFDLSSLPAVDDDEPADPHDSDKDKDNEEKLGE